MWPNMTMATCGQASSRHQATALPPARRGGRLIRQRPVVCDLLQELSDKGGAESLTAPASGFYVPHQ